MSSLTLYKLLYYTKCYFVLIYGLGALSRLCLSLVSGFGAINYLLLFKEG